MLGLESHSLNINTPKKEEQRIPHPFLKDTDVIEPEEISKKPKMKMSFTHIKEIPAIQTTKTQALETEKSDIKKETPLHHRHTLAMPFGKNPILMESVKAHEKTKTSFEKQYAKFELVNFLQSGKLNEITDFILEEKGNEIFSEEIERVKNKHAEELKSAEFLNDNEKDWRILTALELFDKGTFDHSIRTYKIARQVLESGPFKLRRSIEKEINLDVFYRACLFHDIGKFSIPIFILRSKVTDLEWTRIFKEDAFSEEEQTNIFADHWLSVPDNMRVDYEKLHEFFKQNGFRAVKVVPVKDAYGKDELAILEERGIDKNFTLLEIVARHDKDSATMLIRLNYIMEAVLAANHHHSESKLEESTELPISTDALHIFSELSADTIHTIDVLSAISEKRSYQSEDENKDWAKKYNVIISHVESGLIKNAWVAAAIMNFVKDSDDEFKNGDPSRKEMIKKFIQENLPSDAE